MAVQKRRVAEGGEMSNSVTKSNTEGNPLCEGLAFALEAIYAIDEVDRSGMNIGHSLS